MATGDFLQGLNSTSTASTLSSAAPWKINYQWTTGNSVINLKWDDINNTLVQGEIPAALPPGKRSLGLPDGSKLEIDDLGNYTIHDKDAKVTYKANRIREFSPHLNASDLLAQFVRYVGGLGVRQKEVLSLPIELFINWLVIEAAERDQDQIPAEVVPVERHPVLATARRPRCLGCGKFIPRLYYRNRFPFCGPEHGARHAQRLQIA